jgi:hypothetical protein
MNLFQDQLGEKVLWQFCDEDEIVEDLIKIRCSLPALLLFGLGIREETALLCSLLIVLQ